MSDAKLLANAGTPWEHRGNSYILAVPDTGDELLFQAIHERWARNRLEVLKAGVSPQVYEADVERHLVLVAGNRFAFGAPLSLYFLLSPHGMAEYALLMLRKGQQEGGSEVSPAWLRGLRRSDPGAWDALTALILHRDFPQLAPAAESLSGAPATPAPGIDEYSSSSRDGPGARKPALSGA